MSKYADVQKAIAHFKNDLAVLVSVLSGYESAVSKASNDLEAKTKRLAALDADIAAKQGQAASLLAKAKEEAEGLLKASQGRMDKAGEDLKAAQGREAEVRKAQVDLDAQTRQIESREAAVKTAEEALSTKLGLLEKLREAL